MKRITPRTCLWPAAGCLCITFALSIGLTYRSDHYCYAGTCGEWLFPFQARLHVIVWYMWLSLSVTLLALRTFQPSVRNITSKSLGIRIPLVGKQLHVSGLLLVIWILSLYGILISIWWIRLRDYFQERGRGLPGNNIVAAVALMGHLADVTMGMVLLPVSRHSALASFFKLSHTTIYTFHMAQAYVLCGLVITHGSLYAAWAALYSQNSERFRHILPVLNPTYLYHEVWPGNTSGLGTWRASLIFTGSVSSLIMMSMVFTSFPVVRREHFNVFYFTHLLGIAAVVVICLHASTMFYCTIPGLSMWILDWSMRVFELREKLDSRLKALGNGWYSLTLRLPRKRLSGCACHSPLADFYIHHSESSIREIHPFTTITHLASKKPEIQDGESFITIQFLFRPGVPNSASQAQSQPSLKKSTQWTNRLASLVDEEKAEVQSDRQHTPVTKDHTTLTAYSDTVANYGAETTLRLEGPYFTPASPEAYKTVVCLVAGTGLSGAIAIAAAFRAQRARPRSNLRIPAPIAAAAVTTIPAERSGHWNRCVVLWTVRERDFVSMPFFNELKCEGLEFRVHKTGNAQPRLDMSKSLTEICGEEGEESWCYISGPDGFISAAEQSCSEIKSLTWFAARGD